MLWTDYHHAALQRLDDSRVLIDNGAYPGAIYFSGLAAESMIKAFIVSRDGEIKGHNFAKLAEAANLGRRLKVASRDEVNAAITEAAALWRNLFRYCSAGDLDRIGREWRIRFEVQNRMMNYADLGAIGPKLWAERLYNLASLIVLEGDLLWQSK